MEKRNNGKVIAIVALLVAVVGLTLGFAAFSSTLTITSTADVQLDESVWNVGFSTTTSAVATTATPVTGKDENNQNDGTLSLTQFVISQTTNATLETVNGSSVEYDFHIVNDGKVDAYLNSVTMGSLTCTYASTSRYFDDNNSQVTPEPSTSTISTTDCATLFTATLTLGSTGSETSYTSGSSAQTSGFGNTHKLAAPVSPATATSIPAKLTIAYNNNSISSVTNVPTGDFTVALGDSTVVYGSTAN